MSRKVVITGMGAVTPLGNNVEEYWNGLKEGKLGIEYLPEEMSKERDIKVAGLVKDFNPLNVLKEEECKRLSKVEQYILVATDEAVKSSKLNFKDEDGERVGVYIGAGIGGQVAIEEEISKSVNNKDYRLDSSMIGKSFIDKVAANVAIKYNCKGSCISMVSACSTGNNNIGEAYRAIKDGYADVIISGSGEAGITPVYLDAFNVIKTLSKSNDKYRASIPFDKERNGFVMGEGAGILILESEDHAKERGADILAEVVGYGCNCDAYHITSPDPSGKFLSEAIKMAIKESGINKEEVSYINAHGTSTKLNDSGETKAIKTVFEECSKNIPVSSTKSMTGHLLGGAGAIEAIACVKALNESFIPPTIGLKVEDEELDLDYVPNVGRNKKLNYALSNACGFGGHNAVLLMKNRSHK